MIENDVAACIRAGDVRQATKLVIEAFGGEVFGYVASLLKDVDLAADAFSAACESVLTGISGFRGQSSLRTWFYAIARHAAYLEARRERRGRGTSALLLEADLEAPIRTATATFRKTEVKESIARLRASLSEEERELLLLRVDRRLSWNEIAVVQLGGDAGGEDAVKVTAARCRKQFERAKQKLRKLAEQEGLVRTRDDE